MFWLALLLFAVILFAATSAGCGALIPVLRRHALLDMPNERSNHLIPIPRGAGIVVMAVLLPAWALIALLAPGAGAAPFSDVLILLICAAALAVVSWFDDVKGVAPLIRLFIQFAIVAIAAGTLPGGSLGGPLGGPPGGGLVFQGLLPPLADHIAAAFAWVWFLNLFNFMDGIDSITGIEASSIGAGVFLLCLFIGARLDLGLFGLAVAAVAAGFLRWNWPPAKIFIGDVGSVPLGFLLGWLLLSLAAGGFWAPAVILPLVYLADTTITLARRLLRREKVWSAHTEHYYQRAVRAGWGHAEVTRLILLANLGLIALAMLAASGLTPAAAPLAAIGAAFIVAALLARLGRAADSRLSGGGQPG